VADLFFLVMLRVVAIFSAQDDGTRESSMAKFTVRTFAAFQRAQIRRIPIPQPIGAFFAA
jgi:hypothetical protein